MNQSGVKELYNHLLMGFILYFESDVAQNSTKFEYFGEPPVLNFASYIEWG